MMIKNQCTPYLLGTNVQAAKNLDEQHEQIASFAYEQLEKAGLRRGMIIWDIGCGSGAMTEYLAHSVGEEGHVYALDVSDDQVARTRERLHEAGLKNFTCLQADITAILDLPKEEADLVYARMVLMHLKNPETALLQMAQLLKRGGVLSLQESIMHTALIAPPHQAVEDYFRTLIKLGNFHGADFNIGEKLSQLCEKLGYFETIEHYVTERTLSAGMAKKILLSRLLEWEERALEAKLLTTEKLKEWKKSLENFQGDEFLFKPAAQGHLIAKKK